MSMNQPDPVGDPVEAASSVNIPREPVPNLILQAARRIDQYFAAHAVSPECQTRPHVTLKENSMHIEVGQPFTIKLAGPINNLHETKASEIEDMDLVVQIANGSASGVYTFYALKAGETRIRLLLADASTLIVVSLDVHVKISHNMDTSPDLPFKTGEESNYHG